MKYSHPTKRTIIYTASVAIFLVILLWLTKNFDSISYLLFDEKFEYRGEFLKSLITVLGGVLVGFGLWLNFKRTRSIERQVVNQTEQINKLAEQNELTRKGQVDERFKNAIEHLGNDKPAIVLGGVHALNRIATEDKSYRFTVFHTLCSYIRSETQKIEINNLDPAQLKLIKPTIVIQTIIDILFRGNPGTNIYDGIPANLANSILINANLENANLRRADLSNSHLSYCSLAMADLSHAFLQNSHIISAFLFNTNLSGSNLCYVQMFDTFCNRVVFVKADFLEANLTKSSFLESDMQFAKFHGATFRHINFKGADLERASFANAFFEDVIFDVTKVEKTLFPSTLFENYKFPPGSLIGEYKTI